jgi:transposase InsO family protein
VKENKTATARALRVARSMLYHIPVQEKKDWTLKQRIEEVLREHRAYGSRLIALTLKRNRKAIQRVMRKYGIKPFRRRRQRWLKKAKIVVSYANLLFSTTPTYLHQVWAADFTEIEWHGRTIYIATVIDLYTRQIVGVSVAVRKGTPLVMQALMSALLHHPPPSIFHSDNGREYDAMVFIGALTKLQVLVSRSHPGCPWENGYQESFYGKFKLDLGDPNRCMSLGELVALIYRTIWEYNNTRIHSALRMPPRQFADAHARATLCL